MGAFVAGGRRAFERAAAAAAVVVVVVAVRCRRARVLLVWAAAVPFAQETNAKAMSRASVEALFVLFDRIIEGNRSVAPFGERDRFLS
jgi:hypothetical protein